MIELRRCNYFTGEASCVSNAVSSIVKFLEVDGRNPILFTPPKPIGAKGKSITSLIYHLNPQVVWNDFEDFRSKIEDPANRFRVNLMPRNTSTKTLTMSRIFMSRTNTKTCRPTAIQYIWRPGRKLG